MLAKTLMIQDFPVISLNDTSDKLSEIAFDYDVFHIPVNENDKCLGVLPFDILGDLDILDDRKLFDFREDILPISINENHYIFDAFSPIIDHELTALPVVSEAGEFRGIVRPIEIVRYFQNTVSISENGAFITLRVSSRDYNLQEMARIVESNNAKILSLHIDRAIDADTLLVTIKINRRILTHILATFDRFGYTYVAHSADEDRDNDLDDRYNLLMKMLNI